MPKTQFLEICFRKKVPSFGIPNRIRHEIGQKRCTFCGIFLSINDARCIYCKTVLRTKPRSKKNTK